MDNKKKPVFLKSVNVYFLITSGKFEDILWKVGRKTKYSTSIHFYRAVCLDFLELVVHVTSGTHSKSIALLFDLNDALSLG